MTARSKKHLVWIDCEMTGLDPAHDGLLEIATIITNYDLDIIARGPELAIRQSEAKLAAMDSWNRRTHKKSGLLDRVRSEGVTVAEAERQTLAFVKRHCYVQTLPTACYWSTRKQNTTSSSGFAATRGDGRGGIQTSLSRRWNRGTEGRTCSGRASSRYHGVSILAASNRSTAIHLRTFSPTLVRRRRRAAECFGRSREVGHQRRTTAHTLRPDTR